MPTQCLVSLDAHHTPLQTQMVQCPVVTQPAFKDKRRHEIAEIRGRSRRDISSCDQEQQCRGKSKLRG